MSMSRAPATIREKAQDDQELRQALISVFLTPPSTGILEERLRKRGTDSPRHDPEAAGRRPPGIAQWKHFDYLLVSGSIEEDLRRMLAIVEAEKMRSNAGAAAGVLDGHEQEHCFGVTGSIAAYKAAELASQLIKQGCEVHVVMTADALRFITPLAFKTLSRHPVIADLYDEEEGLEAGPYQTGRRSGPAAGRAGHRQHHCKTGPGPGQ